MRIFLLAVVYGLVQGLLLVLNTMFQDMLGGRPYYLTR